MKRIGREQAAWVAGVFEGEACFYVIGKGHVHSRITVSQKDPQILKHIQQITGIGNLYYMDKRRYPIWCYNVYRHEDIIDLIREVYPFLVNRRTRKRAWSVYRIAKLRRDASHSVSPVNFMERLKIYTAWKTTQSESAF